MEGIDTEWSPLIVELINFGLVSWRDLGRDLMLVLQAICTEFSAAEDRVR